MKHFYPLFAVTALAIASVSGAQAADRIGVRHILAPNPERGTDLDVTLWYPATATGTPVLVGDNAVFQGTPAHRGAQIADGRFPVILLAHGGLRAAPNQDGWIAARLAAQGFIVAAPQRPAPGQLDAADAVREIWLRPGDLSATLTALERDPALAGKMNAQEAGALGFLLGGSSVLALAGAQHDAEAYARSCDNGGVGPDCAWFAKSGIDLHEIDAVAMERSALDPRIKAVVAVDPELAATFTAASLSGISIPVRVINLGGADTMLPVPHDQVPGATSFDAFSLCKPAGPGILQDEGDDGSLCKDGARPRSEIHAQLAAMIIAGFKRHLRGDE